MTLDNGWRMVVRMDKNEVLGRRAMDCADDFKWGLGMRDGDTGQICVGVKEDGEGALTYRWVGEGDSVSGWCSSDEDEWPDFDDPATIGCLLSLVLSAWGVGRCSAVAEMTDYAESYDDKGGRFEVRSERVPLFRASGGSRAERLVRALEAAP